MTSIRRIDSVVRFVATFAMAATMMAWGVPASLGNEDPSPAPSASALTKDLPVNAGSLAPNFTRMDFGGKPVTLGAYRGKAVLLDFWASWCAPCLQEMPHLIALQKQYGEKLQIIGVSMDDRVDAAGSVTKRFVFNYPLVMGDAKLGSSYGGVLGLPELFLIGRNGRVLNVWRGDVKQDELEQAVEAAVR